MLKYLKILSFLVITTGLVCSCGGPRPKPVETIEKGKAGESLVRISPSDYPDFKDDLNYAQIKDAAGKTLEYLNKVPATKKFRYGKDSYSALQMRSSIKKFMDFVSTRPSQSAMNDFIRKNCIVYKASGSPETGKVLFTGYYEPFLKGSLTKTDRYRYPVYGKPEDLLSIDLSKFGYEFKGKKIKARYTGDGIEPYYDRYAIEEKNAIKDKAEIIAWVEDRLDLFFLQIQGSGVIFLESGGTMKVHYLDSNGQPYSSISKYFTEKGIFKKDEVSMQKMRQWMLDHPDKISEVLGRNKSYVFFEEEPDGPIGCLNVKITAGRSLALDRKVYPDAGLAFVATEKPVVESNDTVKKWIPFSRFIFNQDTGGAITGPGRADFFWGNGEYARTAAGHMKNQGDLYFLFVKP